MTNWTYWTYCWVDLLKTDTCQWNCTLVHCKSLDKKLRNSPCKGRHELTIYKGSAFIHMSVSAALASKMDWYFLENPHAIHFSSFPPLFLFFLKDQSQSRLACCLKVKADPLPALVPSYSYYPSYSPFPHTLYNTVPFSDHSSCEM